MLPTASFFGEKIVCLPGAKDSDLYKLSQIYYKQRQYKRALQVTPLSIGVHSPFLQGGKSCFIILLSYSAAHTNEHTHTHTHVVMCVLGTQFSFSSMHVHTFFGDVSACHMERPLLAWKYTYMHTYAHAYIL